VTESDPKSRLAAGRYRCWLRVSLSVLLAGSLSSMAQPSALAAETSVTPASADEPQRSLAKAKYAEGVEAYRATHYVDAVRLFLEADAISPSAALSYNIARAYEKLSDDAQTLRWYRNYLRLNPQAKNRAEVEGFIRSLSRALAKRGIQQLTVLTWPPGATVTIDGTPLGVSPLTVELRPGKHSALLSHRGFVDFNGSFVLPQATPIDVGAALQAAANSEPVTSAPQPEGARRFGIVPYVTLGAAAACLAGAGLFELSRHSAQSDARSEQVQLEYERDIQTMHSRQTSARVLLGVGGALAVTGATLLVFNTRLTAESRAVAASVPGGAMLSWERRF
jgi:hypothetical protein